jgi:hypothetical protein
LINLINFRIAIRQDGRIAGARPQTRCAEQRRTRRWDCSKSAAANGAAQPVREPNPNLA